jgi:glyoxylase-like metal-dependent hydrolase (beta-lactamase superfamily II)
MNIKKFTFGPFQENTFVLFDDSGECVIIDPGCYTSTEQTELADFIEDNTLKPVQLLNTHCHVDHIAGNRFVNEKFGLLPIIHELDIPVLEMQESVSAVYGLPCEKSPMPEFFMEDGDTLSFGQSHLEVIFAPGHCPGHVVFLHKNSKQLIGGDVLFYGSVGRKDLPGGDHATLIDSIKNKIFPLGDEIKIYCGHGPETTIGHERKTNPFLV